MNPVAAGAGEIVRLAGEYQSQQRQAERQAQAQRMQAAEATGSAWEEAKAAGQNVLESPLSFFASALGSLVPTAAASVVGGAPAALTLGAGMGAGAVKQSIAERTEQEALQAGQTALAGGGGCRAGAVDQRGEPVLPQPDRRRRTQARRGEVQRQRT